MIEPDKQPLYECGVYYYRYFSECDPVYKLFIYKCVKDRTMIDAHCQVFCKSKLDFLTLLDYWNHNDGGWVYTSVYG